MNTIMTPSANLTTVTSGGPAFLSSTTSNFTCIDTLSTNNPHPPAACGFSGLPLFPPTDRNRNTVAAAATTSSTTAPVALTPISYSMDDTSATAWIDGVIKDLIHTSSNVCIPQFIHNVREIIYPCNPNLAALLEYRLRFLTDTLERRRKEAPSLHLPEGLLQRHHSQQQGSSGLTLNLDSALDNLPNFSLNESCAMSQYLSWAITPLPISNSAATGNNQQYHHNQISSSPSMTTPPVLSLNQTQYQVRQPHQAQEHPFPEENSSPVEKTTTSTTTTTPTTTVQRVQACSARDRKESYSSRRETKKDYTS